MKENMIKVSGAREHNLKNITVEIPHGKHTVISGVSGSGKSTLAYDVIYAAGQKRLLDCFSEQTKLFTSQLKQPDVNFIKGLTPVISLKQHEPRKNPRATIGTLSELSTYLRYLYSLLGMASCPFCNHRYTVRNFHTLVKELERIPSNTTIELAFPVYRNKSKSYEALFNEIREKGYKRIEIDGERKDLRDWIEVTHEPKSIMVIADKIYLQESLSRSDIQSIEKTIRQGNGFIRLSVLDKEPNEAFNRMMKKHGCSCHGMMTLDILPSFFSFNDLNSGCEACHGTGIKKSYHPSTIIKNKGKSLKEGPFFSQVYNMKQPYRYMLMYSLAKHYGFSFDTPFEDLSKETKEILYYGTKGERFPLLKPEGYDKEMPSYTPRVGEKVEFEGIINRLNRYYNKKQQESISDKEASFFDRFMVDEVCSTCCGTRLKPNRQLITLKGYNYYELGNLELNTLYTFIREIEIPGELKDALVPVLNEIYSRLDSLIKIGLGYLSLNRRADTLSGGEHQRVRLAGQIGSGLMGLTYIIDEPTVGLHGMDNIRIIKLLEDLCAQGNTVITIEHDIDIIKRAEYIIEMGPGAGVYGGKVIASGTIEDIKTNEYSILSRYLCKGVHKEEVNHKEILKDDWIQIIGAKENNLRNIDVSIPLNRLVCLTGISGSGKSSLAIEILYKYFWSTLHDPRVIPGKHEKIKGAEKVKDVYCIDQSSMGRSKRSIPATFIGVFDKIRTLFSETEDARECGLDSESYFSFNAKGGCPSCKGLGYLDTHIHYLGDLETLCPECKGQRYTKEVLEVLYKGKNIAEVLSLDFLEALEFFRDQEYIQHKLKYVCDLGLGYLSLGQATSTISGGEAQRLSLAKEISKIRGKTNMLYILDEPTTGLHSKDIEKLMMAMRTLIDQGNSLIVIEHNPDVIISSDYIIDMGPLAGSGGGEVVASGSFNEIIDCPKSKTAQYLKNYLSE